MYRYNLWIDGAWQKSKDDHLPIASEGPHGGFKKSGFGKDMSIEAIKDYQIGKHMMIHLAS